VVQFAFVINRSLCLVTLWTLATSVLGGEPFLVRVVDADTKRGVPLVELRTTHNVRLFTDNAGLVAIDDAGLMNQEVFFFVASHGYEFSKDGFGYRGTRLRVEPGRSRELAIKRLNIAERLYRVTGAGRYEHTLRAGQKSPLKAPRSNAEVVGCDSAQTAIYDGKLYWFWGDTSRISYPLGNFQVSGATSKLIQDGALDPALGVDLEIFADDKGFARPMASIPGPGPTWLKGLVAVKDAEGREHLVASYSKIEPPLKPRERGLCEFDAGEQKFKKLFAFEKSARLIPTGHAFRRTDGDDKWLYFGEATPQMRVRDRYESLIEPREYQAVDADVQFSDAQNAKAVKPHHGSVAWNDYRKKWVSIFVREYGDASYLGEIYYAEAVAPEGPWRKAVKIVTHDRYSFYDPKQHPYFSDESGRYVYFEGTYSMTFSGNKDPTPLYDYNQIMYRLDLADERLKPAREPAP
jgi:hypothetical protein